MDNDNEEEIIANAFILLREGILSQDWQKVLQSYKDVSGEELEIPKEPEKTKLEKIREKIGKQSSVAKTSPKRGKKTTVDKTDDEEIEMEILPQKGGTRFATNGFQVISTIEDEQEKEQNKKVAKKKYKMPRKETPASEQSLFRHNDTPKNGPPW